MGNKKQTPDRFRALEHQETLGILQMDDKKSKRKVYLELKAEEHQRKHPLAKELISHGSFLTYMRS